MERDSTVPGDLICGTPFAEEGVRATRTSARYFSGHKSPLRRLTLLFESLYTQVCGTGVAGEQYPPDSAAAPHWKGYCEPR
jgi:hypothetical protein